MNSFCEVFRLLNKKPFTWIVPSLFMMPFCIFEYQVIYPIIHGISSVGVGNVYELIIYFIQFALTCFNGIFFSFQNNIIVLIYTLIVICLFSLFLSGYLYILNGWVNQREIHLIYGLKKYFFRINKAVLMLAVIGFFLIVFAAIVAMPALIFTRTFSISDVFETTKSQIDSIIICVSLFLVDVTTVLVILFQLSLLILYFSFGVASIYSFDKGSFKPAKCVVNRFFWSLVFRQMIFGILFLIFEIIFAIGSFYIGFYFPIKSFEIFLIVFVNAIIKSFLVSGFISYIFIEYRKGKLLIFG